LKLSGLIVPLMNTHVITYENLLFAICYLFFPQSYRKPWHQI